MIHVTRLNHEDLIVNSDLIEFIEITPDTVLTLTTGKKVMVREKPNEVLDRILAYRERVGPRIAHAGMNPPRPNHDDEYEEAA